MVVGQRRASDAKASVAAQRDEVDDCRIAM
jgi:hypothetical protein